MLFAFKKKKKKKVHATNIAVSILSGVIFRYVLFAEEIFSWMLNQAAWFIFFFAQAGHEAVLGGVQIWQRGTVRMCDKSGNLRAVDIIFGHSGRETGKGLSLGTDTSARYKGMRNEGPTALCFTQWVFALGIIFQLAWHVREAALPRKPVHTPNKPGVSGGLQPESKSCLF